MWTCFIHQERERERESVKILKLRPHQIGYANRKQFPLLLLLIHLIFILDNIHARTIKRLHFLIVKAINPVSVGGEHWVLPPWQNLLLCFRLWLSEWFQLMTIPIYIYIFVGSFSFQAKNDIEKVLEVHFWGRGHFEICKIFISEVTEACEGSK